MNEWEGEESVNALSREPQSVPDDVKDFCKYDPWTVREFNIVVSTCVSAALLYWWEVPPFDYIFIDESSHATEPEALVAIAGLIRPTSRIVLTGDPKQLGPIVHSHFCAEHHFEESLQERLMNESSGRYQYQPSSPTLAPFGKYDPRYITKLVENYRSHPRIIEIPNERFYDNDLIASADKAMRESLCEWPELPQKNQFPIMFEGIAGKEAREGDSPSWFNPGMCYINIWFWFFLCLSFLVCF